MKLDIINYQFSLYILHQLVNWFLYMKLYFQSPLFICFILFSGIVAGLNPCIISMLPLILSYSNRDNRGLMSYSFFIFGVLSVELISGCIVSIIGYRYYIFSITLPLLSAVLLIFLGLMMLRVLPSSIWNTISFSSRLFYISNIHLRYFLIGVLLTINTLTCTLPIVLTVFNLLLAINNSLTIILYSIIYTFGYICPVLFFCAVIEYVIDVRFFKVFIISKWYTLLGGSFILTSNVFKFLRLMFYSLQ